MSAIEIIRNIRLASRVVGTKFELETGATIPQLLVLHSLDAGDKIQIQVSRETGIDRSTITNVVNRLAKAGYIKITDNPEDARVKMLHITASGKQQLRKLEKTLDKISGNKFGLSDQKADQLIELLANVSGVPESEAA